MTLPHEFKIGEQCKCCAAARREIDRLRQALPGQVPDGCQMEDGYLGGRLRLAGHRISMAQIIAEIAECDGVKLFACSLDLDDAEVTRALHGLSVWLDTFNANPTI